jgi:hypothetical protein
MDVVMWRKFTASTGGSEQVVEQLTDAAEGLRPFDDADSWSPDGRFFMVYRVASNGSESLEFLDTGVMRWVTFKSGPLYAGVDNCLGWKAASPHSLVLIHRANQLEASLEA